MSTGQNVEQNEKKVNDELQAINREALNVNESTLQGQTQPQTTDSKLQTEEMEVHKHPHNVMHTKNWKEYFLEFLMIFLAVTLGFFAESYREHLGDRSKEKEYMHSMLSDLQKDTAKMNASIRNLIYEVNGHDSLEYMLESPLNNSEYYHKLYYMNTVFTWDDVDVTFEEGTFTELKSSGNLRLIQSKAVMDSILAYQFTIDYCSLQHNWCTESISKTYFFATDIFDISCYKKYNDFLNSADYENRIYLPYEKVKELICEKPQLLSSDVTILKKYSRLVNNEKNQMALYLFYVKASKQTASRLIEQIKTEYNF